MATDKNQDPARTVAFAREASLGMPGSIKDVADFLLSEGTGIANLTMAQIAARTYTSKPTLVRFAKQAGYAGWRDYRHDLLVAMTAMEADRAASVEVDVNYPFATGDSVADVAGSIARIQRLAVEEVERTLDRTALESAARALLDAHNVLYLGAMQNHDRGNILAANLMTIGIVCHVMSEDRAASLARLLGPEDCVVVTSYSGALTFGSMRLVPSLVERGVTVVAVTNSERSSLADIADHALCFPPLEHYHDKVGAFYSGACTSLILDMLYAACYASRYDESRESRASVVRSIRGMAPDDL